METFLDMPFNGSVASGGILCMATWTSGSDTLIAAGDGEMVRTVSVESKEVVSGFVANSDLATALPVVRDDGRRIPGLVLQQSWTNRLWPGIRDGQEVVVSAGADGSVRLWNVREGSSVLVFGNHGSRVGALSGVSAVGRAGCVVSGSRDGEVRVWDLHSGELMNRWIVPKGIRDLVLLELNGMDVTVTGSMGGELRVWSCESGELLLERKGQISSALSLTAWPGRGERYVAVGGAQGEIMTWDAQSGEAVARMVNDSWDENVTCLVGLVIEGTRVVASMGAVNPVQLWNADTGELCGKVPRPLGVRSMAGVGNSLAIGTANGVKVHWFNSQAGHDGQVVFAS